MKMIFLRFPADSSYRILVHSGTNTHSLTWRRSLEEARSVAMCAKQAVIFGFQGQPVEEWNAGKVIETTQVRG